MAENEVTVTDDQELPPLGELSTDPRDEDSAGEEVAHIITTHYWQEWLDDRRPWQRVVEDNVRMLMGQQYDIWIPAMEEFVDIREYFANSDEFWRRFPVFNWTAHAYATHLSKLTENMPVLGSMPASADVKDSTLSEIWGNIWRYEFHQMELPEQYHWIMGWQLIAGRAVVKGRWDMLKGPPVPVTGEMDVVLQTLGGPVNQRLQGVPYLVPKRGEPIPHVLDVGEDGTPIFGEPTIFLGGDMTADVINPLSYIVPQGPELPHRKPWGCHKYFITRDEFRRRYNREPEGEECLEDNDVLLQLDYMSQYGMTQPIGGGIRSPSERARKGLIAIWELWQRERLHEKGMEKGRLTQVSRYRTLLDEPHPYVNEKQTRAFLPFWVFDLPGYPFRQEGNTPYEITNPVARSVNRIEGGLLDSAEAAITPQREVSNQANIDEDHDFNDPNAVLYHDAAPGTPVVTFAQPPTLPLGADKMSDKLVNWVMTLGRMNLGGEGTPVTNDASGELQREVRFDADRPWGSVLRANSYVWARMSEDVKCILQTCMTDARLLTIAGEDLAPAFLSVAPALFEGRINVFPLPESQILETRQDRQNRITALVQQGLLMPEQALEILNMPDVARVSRPGGPAYQRVVREHAEMYLGQPAPVLPEHNHEFDLELHALEQQTLYYRNQPDQIKLLFRAHVAMHQQLGAAQALAALDRQTDVAAAGEGMAASKGLAPAEGPSKGGGKPAAKKPEPGGRPTGPRPPARGTQPALAR